MTPKRENELMLARMLGVSESEAAQRLTSTVVVTRADGEADAFAVEIETLLARTLTPSAAESADVELAIGCEPSGRARVTLFVSLSDDRVVVSKNGPAIISECHPFIQALAACYVAAVCVDAAAGMNKGQPDPFVVHFDDISPMNTVLRIPILLDHAVLAGAGAIGNGLLRALRHLDVRGSLIIADPKRVSPGNGNRCLYFDEASVGKDKATELCAKAQSDFPALSLTPFVGTLTELVPQLSGGRVRRVLVGTDSRRSRRTIQSELPLEVVDASTTGADEVIVHSHRQPTADACLACIYRHIPEDHGRERDIAAGLGVSLDDVRKSTIDADAAGRIAAEHPGIEAAAIVGTAYDSLFKALCSEQALLRPGGEQVLAPFAFVSSLAGILMAVELARLEDKASSDMPNYFFVDPWLPPNPRARMRKRRTPDCDFCSQANRTAALREVWKDVLSVASDGR